MESYHCGGHSAKGPSWKLNVSKSQTFLPRLLVSGNCVCKADSLKSDSDILQSKEKVCKQTWELIAHFLQRTRWVRIICLSDSFRNLLGSKLHFQNRDLLKCRFLYRREVKRNLCVYTLGQGTKLEIKRKYFFQLIFLCN